MTEFHFDEILGPQGWMRHTTVSVDAAGRIAHITEDTAPSATAVRHAVALPGLANLHSHAFQRGMAGLSERRGPGEDSFWSWRQIMYAFNDHLTPDHVEAIAALVYVEMLETGFTSAGEFHYLHHDRDGQAFADRAEIAGRICAAAETAGIALTLLPVFYRWAGFGEQAPDHGQRRFIHDPHSYAELMSASRAHVEQAKHGVLGIAPHSLRAASTADIEAILPLAEGGPVHIHIAEQVREIEDCCAAIGARPVQHLMDTQPVDERWCLVHATHMDAGETEALARSGAVAGLCPLTEANLGDGLFPAREYLAAGGRFGIGSDSHIRIDLAEELRLLEYGRRLVDRRRNVLAREGESTGRRLFGEAVSGGAAALQQPAGGIAVGQRADFVVLDENSAILAGRAGDARLDSWLFCGDGRQVETVYVGGKRVVEQGRALCRDRVEKAYAQTMTSLMEHLA